MLGGGRSLQVEKVLPELVHTDGNGYKYVAYGKVSPPFNGYV